MNNHFHCIFTYHLVDFEKVHLYALKKFLFVDMKTPNDLIYKELNRYPVTINCAINCIRYWLRLVEMDAHRIPKKAYKMLKFLDDRGKQNWVSKVRECLCQNGFGYVWYSQSVGNKRAFLILLKQRLIDVRWQNLTEHKLITAIDLIFSLIFVYMISFHCLCISILI